MTSLLSMCAVLRHIMKPRDQREHRNGEDDRHNDGSSKHVTGYTFR